MLTWAQYGFCAEFLKVRGREFIAKVVLGFALVVCAIQYFALFGPGTTTICYMIYFPVSAFAVYILAKACRTSRSLDHVVMLGAVLVCIAMMIHDFGIIAEPSLWGGIGFLLVPYSGLIMFSAFCFSVGRRFVGALAQVEGMNAVLETRVAEATRSLEKSEQARHELQMVHAIESERERMMQEMHDGIGSSLTSALAMAQRRQESQHTIETLKRTLTDLKIAVDSLEPIEGDVIALMANLRHRVEPDLKEAGIRTLWNMSPCAPLPWLDPINALHVLRIMQEGISNVLTHAHATVIDFACAPLERGSRAGVSIAIGDNGLGMRALEGASVGRGLSNMRARAESVGGIFAFENRAEGGTRLMLWLPLSVAAEPVN